MHVVLDAVSILDDDFNGSIKSGALETAVKRLNELDLEKEAFAGAAVVLILRLIQMLSVASKSDVDAVLVMVRELVDSQFGG